ncbi:ABC transporter substrate-binding protein [Pseudonocardia sp. RS11V-5]|uniref:ABC transporter substrate-binding protein n=1 Tax=Pseudonocardia terrae TaxID=2905831 RepID=UPI001E4C9717|nr:ABC transporter substrate-binding protein [Pseudonocardia terrae]MCE3550883.1 ABC transporter substrate-binding protein [Pseudonocardia terrae]
MVALGYSDTDALLAVGVKPVGIVDWFQVPPANNTWSWEEQAFGGTVPEVVGVRDEYDLEKVAALRSDLVVAAYSGMSEEQSNPLSQITKVVAQPVGFEPFAAPWQALTTQITKAVGQEARGRELVAGVERKIADARSAHPEWVGQTAVTAAYGGGQYFAFTAGDPKTDLLTQLGFTIPAELDAPRQGGTAMVSAERVDLLDVDKLVWVLSTAADEAEVRARPEYAAMPVAQQDRALFLLTEERQKALAAAFSYNSVLSLPYVVDQLAPQLADLPPAT